MKTRRRAAAKKARRTRRKPIMRHSREGVRSRKSKARKPKKKSAARRAAPRAAKRAASRKALARKAKPRARTKSKPASRAVAAAAPSAPARSAPRSRRRGLPDKGLRLPYDGLRGLGGESAGQSGDTESLERTEDVDSESVEELVEEGQAFEAGIVSGVEEADLGDPGGIRTREVPEDDVPQEYLDED